MIKYDNLQRNIFTLTVVAFLGGGLIWMFSSQVKNKPISGKPIAYSSGPDSIVASVGKQKITFEEVEWEASILQTDSDPASEDLTAIPDNNTKSVQGSLKEMIISNIIERKVLYEFIQKDKKFSFADSSRYSECVAEWNAQINSSPLFDSAMKKEQLKKRICESSIITQYLDEKLYPTALVSQQEINDYYQSEKNSFTQPAMATIRQIVLASEKQAKKVRHRLKRSNFSAKAKEHSISPDAANGGLIGPFKKGELLSIFDVAFRMRRGEIRGILKSPYGFHFIMLEKKTKKRSLSLAEAAPKIRRELLEKKKKSAYNELMKNALISIDVTRPKPIW